MPRPTPVKVKQAARDIGEQLLVWRKLQGLTAAQVAERVDISRGTLRRIETGDFGVNTFAFLKVARALGILNTIVTATDPYETDIGRIRADQTLPQRVRP